MTSNRLVTEPCACGGVIGFVYEAGRAQLPEAMRTHQNTALHESWWRSQFRVCPTCLMVRVPPTRTLCNFCRRAPTAPLSLRRLRDLGLAPRQIVDNSLAAEA